MMPAGITQGPATAGRIELFPTPSARDFVATNLLHANQAVVKALIEEGFSPKSVQSIIGATDIFLDIDCFCLSVISVV
jgi:hypothetical protein